MMLLFLVKKNKLFFSNRATISISSSSACSSRQLIKTLLSFSTTTTTKATKTEQILVLNSDFNIMNYLINSCGLSSEQALKASKNIAHLQSPSKPDAVISFLKERGFGEADIAQFICKVPKLLCVETERTLKPKFMVLQEMGFSRDEIVKLVSANPTVVKTNSRAKIEFWRGILGSNENLLRANRRNHHLYSSSIDERLLPNLLFMRQCGISDNQLRHLLVGSPWFLTRSMDNIKAIVKRAEALGVPVGSKMFHQALLTMSCTSVTTFDNKIRFWKSLGFSEAEVLNAIRGNPVLLRLSEEKLQRVVEYLMKEAGCSLTYIASHTGLFQYSLERRLIPRVCVLKILKSKNLLPREYSLLPLICMSSAKFLNKFVLPHKENVAGLEELYLSACSGES